jgi:hypothetical protein
MIEVKAAPARETLYDHLSEGDLDAVFALHLAATAAIGRPDLIKPESREFFQRILAGGGTIIGAFRDRTLVGYGVLQTDLPPSEDARPQLGLTSRDVLAKLAGESVQPVAWGAGTDDVLIDLRIAEARRAGIRHLYSTSAPGNARSWANLLDAGFAVRGLIEKYGGHLRYLLHRDLHAAEPQARGGVWCDMDDIARQRTLIAAGHAGIAWRRRADGGRDLLFGGPA